MSDVRDDVEQALVDLIETVEATGGITRNERGEAVPVGDPAWVDLATVYLSACTALGREPKISNDDLYPAEEA